MPPQKKSRGKYGMSSSEPAYDHLHFFDIEASEAYTKSLGRSILIERGFDFDNFGLEENFRMHNWSVFLETPVQAMVPIV